MRLYERLYRLLDRELRHLEIRHTVDLVAGDLVLTGQKEWLRYIRNNMDKSRPDFDSVVDGYSIHVYWAPGGGRHGFPQQLENRLKGLAAQCKALGIDKPVYVTEFGVKTHLKPAPDGKGSGRRIEFSRDVAFQHAWFMALAPQYGCAGLVKWVLYRTDRRCAWGEWGMIDAPNLPGGNIPLGRAHTYWVTKLFNHLVGPNWKASGFGRSNDGTALVSRFTGPADESVVVLNRREKAQQIVVDRLRPRSYFVADWNGGPAREREHPLTPTDKALQFTVPARSVIALSTRPLQLS
jgi:hypothetical protein